MAPHRPALAALPPLGALALILAGCGASASSAAPVTTVELPGARDPEVKASPPAPAPPEPADPAPDRSPEDGGGIFGAQKGGPDSTPFVARFAAVFRSPAASAQPSIFGGDSVILFTSPVTCDVAALDQAAPPHLRLTLSWSAGQKSTFQQFVMKDGQASRHSGSIQIINAPTNKGDVGRVLIDTTKGANVTGGEIDALVCE